MHVLSIIAGSDDGNAGGSSLISFGILLLIPLAMYFVLIRPQRRRMREQQSLQSSLAVGDEVMLSSGIYGFILDFEDDRVWVEIDDNVQVRVNRGFIQGKVDTGATAAVEPAKGATDAPEGGTTGASGATGATGASGASGTSGAGDAGADGPAPGATARDE